MSLNTVKIEMLGKENFDTWKLQMKAILIKNDNWSYVSGKISKPVNEKDVDEWVSKDEKAKADIILAISPSELKQIKNCETSKDMWVKLHSIYESKGPARKACLLKQLLFCKMKEEENAKDYLKRFFNIIDKLDEINLEINSELLTIILLYSLPDSYENFRCAIETREELPNIESLKIKIIEEFESKMNRKENRNDQTSAFIAGKYKNKPEKYFKKQNTSYDARGYDAKENKNFFKCNYCGKPGHKVANCYKKKQSMNKFRKNDENFAIFENENGEFNLQIMENKENELWCLDSGCTSHMCSNKNKFNHIINENRTVTLADNSTIEINGVGNIRARLCNGDGYSNITLHNVLFVPNLKLNLMSISKIIDQGYYVIFNRDVALIKKEGIVVTVANRIGDLYIIKEDECYRNISSLAAREKTSIEIWHGILGHLNVNSIREMYLNKTVYGLKINPKETMPTCETCLKGKITKKPFKKYPTNITKDLLEVIHMDICGPMRESSHGGSIYFITFIDSYSRWCEVRFLKNKYEALENFKEYKYLVENQTGKRIKAIQTDNGGEFKSKEFSQFLKQCGIKQRFTTPYTPQQNGIAERKNRTLVEMARCMLIQAKLSPKFWAEAIAAANHIRNRCKSTSTNEIPFKMWTGRCPTIAYLRLFGSKVIFLDRTPNKGKFEQKGQEGLLVGYSDENKAYRIWSLQRKQVIVSRDVKFLHEFKEENEYSNFENEYCESNIPNRRTEMFEIVNNEEVQDKNKVVVDVNLKEEKRTESENEGETENFQDEIINREDQIVNGNQDEENLQEKKMKRGPGRPKLIRNHKRGRPKKQYNTNTIVKENVNTENEHNEFSGLVETTLKDVQESSDWKEWKEAIMEEYIALIKNKCWDIVDWTPDKQVIGSKLVLQNKFNNDGSIQRRKARLVAKGFNQKYGIDFKETFAPVVRLNSIRMLMALAVKLNMTVHHIDIKSAFLNGDIEETIFMEIPEMYEECLTELSKRSNLDVEIKIEIKKILQKLKYSGRKLCLLKKSLYGLKQAGRQWNYKLDNKLKELGLMQLNSDQCMYVKREDEELLLAAVYVDDILICSTKYKKTKDLIAKLANIFELRDLGRVNQCLGIQFSQSEKEGEIVMKQAHYVKKLLKDFRMENCKPASTPIEANQQLMKPEFISEREMGKYPYQKLIGSLMFLAVATRPDIMYAVNFLSQFNNNYNETHWHGAKRILRYLKGTQHFALTFKKNEENLVGYVDADWGGCKTTRKSYTGFIYSFAGCTISWEARKQKSVALSSTEAEYMAMSDATKEAIHLKTFLTELGQIEDNENVLLYCDNQGALELAKNQIYHQRTKHIDIRYHFVREHYNKGNISLKYLRSEEMNADIFTKGLPASKHKYFCQNLGLYETT